MMTGTLQLSKESWDIIRNSRPLKVFGLFAISGSLLGPQFAGDNPVLACIFTLLFPVTFYLYPIGIIGMVLVMQKTVTTAILPASQIPRLRLGALHAARCTKDPSLMPGTGPAP